MPSKRIRPNASKPDADGSSVSQRQSATAPLTVLTAASASQVSCVPA
jgi:hypothetical protein